MTNNNTNATLSKNEELKLLFYPDLSIPTENETLDTAQANYTKLLKLVPDLWRLPEGQTLASSLNDLEELSLNVIAKNEDTIVIQLYESHIEPYENKTLSYKAVLKISKKHKAALALVYSEPERGYQRLDLCTEALAKAFNICVGDCLSRWCAYGHGFNVNPD